jgi:hypothetical protein
VREPTLIDCGNSSVGRAQPCQGWGREFESRFPLQTSLRLLGFSVFIAHRATDIALGIVDMLTGYMIYGWVAEWLCSGLQSRVRRFDPDPSLF